MTKMRLQRPIFIVAIVFMMVLSACGGAQTAPAAQPTLTIGEMQTLVAAAAQPAATAVSVEICVGQYDNLAYTQEAGTTKTWNRASGSDFTIELDANCNLVKVTDPAESAAVNSATSMPSGSTPTAMSAVTGNGNPPPASCKEQMMGPFQPPQNDYWYIQVTNEDFPDDDELFSISWTKNITLSEWLVQDGSTTTEVVGVVRGSIQEVQFYQPTSGVYWRLCAHPDVQLANEIQLHAENIAKERNWLKVYNVGDLWMSLQTGDPELIALIKCITPSTQGIPSCQTP